MYRCRWHAQDRDYLTASLIALDTNQTQTELVGKVDKILEAILEAYREDLVTIASELLVVTAPTIERLEADDAPTIEANFELRSYCHGLDESVLTRLDDELKEMVAKYELVESFEHELSDIDMHTYYAARALAKTVIDLRAEVLARLDHDLASRCLIFSACPARNHTRPHPSEFLRVPLANPGATDTPFELDTSTVRTADR